MVIIHSKFYPQITPIIKKLRINQMVLVNEHRHMRNVLNPFSDEY